MEKIRKETVQFLKNLKQNNNREWFQSHKEEFEKARANFVHVIQDIINKFGTSDPDIAKLDAEDCIFRIYRDLRFAKDRSPYKTDFGAVFMHGGKKHGIVGYGIRIEPANSYLAAGALVRNASQLSSLRKAISNNREVFLKIVEHPVFQRQFIFQNEKLKKIPQGFAENDPMKEYLTYKKYFIHHIISEKQIVRDDFVDYCVEIYKQMLPFTTFLKKAIVNKQ